MKLENKHLFNIHSGVRDALKQLDFLGAYAILIIVDENNVFSLPEQFHLPQR